MERDDCLFIWRGRQHLQIHREKIKGLKIEGR